MAVKYIVQTGSSLFNEKARQKRDFVLRPTFKAMHCNKCGRDSIISFHQNQDYPGSSAVDWDLQACCYEFEQRLYQKAGVIRPSKF